MVIEAENEIHLENFQQLHVQIGTLQNYKLYVTKEIQRKKQRKIKNILELNNLNNHFIM